MVASAQGSGSAVPGRQRGVRSRGTRRAATRRSGAVTVGTPSASRRRWRAQPDDALGQRSTRSGTGSPRSRARSVITDWSNRRQRSANGTPASAWSTLEEPGPTPATTRPGARVSRVASAAARAAGPRTEGSEMVVASCSVPAWWLAAASRVRPSSQGREKARWSLAEIAANPRSRAAPTDGRQCGRSPGSGSAKRSWEVDAVRPCLDCATAARSVLRLVGLALRDGECQRRAGRGDGRGGTDGRGPQARRAARHRRGLRRHRGAGRLQGAGRAARAGRLARHRAQRHGRAGGGGLHRPAAHQRRPGADRQGLPAVRGPADARSSR